MQNFRKEVISVIWVVKGFFFKFPIKVDNMGRANCFQSMLSCLFATLFKGEGREMGNLFSFRKSSRISTFPVLGFFFHPSCLHLFIICFQLRL